MNNYTADDSQRHDWMKDTSNTKIKPAAILRLQAVAMAYTQC